MQGGKLRHRVALERSTAARDGMGGRTAAWSSVATVWAAVEGLKAHEVPEHDQVDSHRLSRIRIRYRTDITPQMRITWGTRQFLIRGVMDQEDRQRELHLLVEEIQVR